MPSRVSRAPIHAWSRRACWPLRCLARACLMLLLAMTGALAGPRPRSLRHEDAVVQVAEEDVERE